MSIGEKSALCGFYIFTVDSISNLCHSETYSEND